MYRIWGFGLLVLRLISMLALGFPDNFNLRFRILGLSLEFNITNNSHVWCKFCVWCITRAHYVSDKVHFYAVT